ncbi:hypothetical protein HF086_016380 [Spodoptera exigua]|uniref:Uncharacterized protein n=1 Tax=Spodoptera exigua TaxID=7107 RepID=A0A922SI46_SPOEX|nr:hypothetical protein HF086_016380 [Spodoptera exigua]
MLAVREGIWDRLCHERPTMITDLTNGDVACDSYHQWRRDIEMAEELGLQFYRLSISWPRLLPSGFPNHISEDAKNYYSNLIDGGWTNPLIVDWFVDYARVAYTIFGDRVKWWITINEPLIICDVVYSTAILAPPILSPDIGAHLCSKNVVMAHAKAYRLYDEEFRSKYHGKVSLANHHVWFDPLTPADAELAELARENCVGKYAHPIYSKAGGWPPALEKALGEYYSKLGYSKPVLPPFTQQEIEYVRDEGTTLQQHKSKSQLSMENYELHNIPSRFFFFQVHPEGIRRQLVWLKQQYGDIEYVITENGLSTEGGLDDQDRIDYYRKYLRQVSNKFGLYEVDFNDPMRTRTPRASANFYSNLIKTRTLDLGTIQDEL